jgi:hypothetical protein
MLINVATRVKRQHAPTTFFKRGLGRISTAILSLADPDFATPRSNTVVPIIACPTAIHAEYTLIHSGLHNVITEYISNTDPKLWSR